ncbi:MAG: Hint domain-containing protein [Rhodobacterales bacterium]|nr:Hint domain-containing protein [Rhodobacterales bacterium]
MARKSGLTGTVDAPALAGIAAGTGIRTLDGILPVDYLEPGDRVVTRSGARRLVAVSVQRHLGSGLIRIRASTLGHDRPERDLLIAEGQHVNVRDWRARVLFGTDAAAIPAERLVDGEFILREPAQSVQAPVYLYILRFDEDEVIWAEGLELACPADVSAEGAFSSAESQQTD